jgi:hypothetical protein
VADAARRAVETNEPFGLGVFSAERARRRAVEVTFWAMPIVSVAAMRRAFFDAGAEYGDVVYWSKPADWRMQITTPNNSTYYLNVTTNLADGPVVVEIPRAEGAGVFGSFNDAWQVPLADYGPEGDDRGAGGKYLLLPPGYDGEVPQGYLVVRSPTFNVYSFARLIPASSSEDDVAAALDLARRIVTYPLAASGSPRPSRHIDRSGELYDGIAPFDLGFFELLAQMLAEEPVAERDLVATAMAASIGIAKGEPFAPDHDMAAALTEGVECAHRELMDSVTNVNRIWPRGQWGVAGGSFGPRTEFTFRAGDTYSTDERAGAYFHGRAPPKHVGAATMYLVSARDRDGDLLYGSATYTLRVPADVPARQYWAVTVYDLRTSSFLIGAPKSSIDSYADLDTNSDGSVDLVFSATPPDGNQANWVYVEPGQPFQLAFRLYGPEPAARDGSWTLDDLVQLGDG